MITRRARHVMVAFGALVPACRSANRILAPDVPPNVARAAIASHLAHDPVVASTLCGVATDGLADSVATLPTRVGAIASFQAHVRGRALGNGSTPRVCEGDLNVSIYWGRPRGTFRSSITEPGWRVIMWSIAQVQTPGVAYRQPWTGPGGRWWVPRSAELSESWYRDGADPP